MTDKKENFEAAKTKVEAILFSYGDFLSPKEIMETLSLDSETIVKNILKELKDKFKEGYSFQVEENDNGKWRMVLKEDYDELVSDLISGIEIPPNVLKVLSVIAYEQPVTKTRLSEILGRSVKPEVNYLYRNKFLSYEKVGVGKYYRVTKKFFDYFKLEEDTDFRKEAEKSIKNFLEEPLTTDEINKMKSEEEKKNEEIFSENQ